MTIRVPVIYKDQPLMPMKASRVNKFIKEKKGKICYDRKLNIHYLKLLVLPSGFNLQDITIGIDPGSCFDGFSVVSDTTHHVNIELVQRAKKGKTAIKFFKERQAMNRRTRRNRLRHRPVRFDNRSSKKLTPTIKANVDFRKWLVTKLMGIYPLCHAVVEDVKFNHSRYWLGASFSLAEQGKTEFYSFLESVGLKLELYDGFNTKHLRISAFGKDPKVKDKGDKSFEAHCVDSYVLACKKTYYEHIDEKTGEITIRPSFVNNPRREINKKVIFIEKIVKIRRCLFRTRALYTSLARPFGSSYFRYAKSGVKIPFNCISNKDNIARIKPKGVVKSNHPSKWIYIDNGRAERKHSNTARYGGTTYNRNKNINPKTNETKNRKIVVVQ